MSGLHALVTSKTASWKTKWVDIRFFRKFLAAAGQRDGLARIARTVTMYIERKLVFPMPVQNSKYIDPITEFADKAAKCLQPEEN